MSKRPKTPRTPKTASASTSASTSHGSPVSPVVSHDQLIATLDQAFNHGQWTSLSRHLYNLMASYVTRHQLAYRQDQIRLDRSIISQNLREQLWFQKSRSKSLIGQLLSNMNLLSYTADNTEYAVNVGFSLLFRVAQPFEIHVCYYYNRVNKCLNYFICFQNGQLSKAYLAYRTAFVGCTPNDSAKKLKIPELDKIYTLTGFNRDELPHYEVINLFSEIIMYYEPSQTIGDQPIGFTVNTTLRQFVSQFNNYLHSQHIDQNFIRVGSGLKSESKK
jgi:hypothetical protein